MRRGRALNTARRTVIPDEYLRLLGSRITLALQEEHIRYDETRRKKTRTRYSVERVCRATGIPYQTMQSFVQGKRQPGILDMMEICRFAGIRFEDIMSIIPSRKELDELYDENKAIVLREAEMNKEREVDDDDPDDYDDLEQHSGTPSW